MDLSITLHIQQIDPYSHSLKDNLAGKAFLPKSVNTAYQHAQC